MRLMSEPRTSTDDDTADVQADRVVLVGVLIVVGLVVSIFGAMFAAAAIGKRRSRSVAAMMADRAATSDRRQNFKDVTQVVAALNRLMSSR